MIHDDLLKLTPETSDRSLLIGIRLAHSIVCAMEYSLEQARAAAFVVAETTSPARAITENFRRSDPGDVEEYLSWTMKLTAKAVKMKKQRGTHRKQH